MTPPLVTPRLTGALESLSQVSHSKYQTTFTVPGVLLWRKCSISHPLPTFFAVEVHTTSPPGVWPPRSGVAGWPANAQVDRQNKTSLNMIGGSFANVRFGSIPLTAAAQRRRRATPETLPVAA